MEFSIGKTSEKQRELFLAQMTQRYAHLSRTHIDAIMAAFEAGMPVLPAATLNPAPVARANLQTFPP
ncbi:MAG: hypothetical protein Q7R35_15660 [Elusimicrobiota bacterium]|nr:hypothetical protein [Elusimicrobiota bacterium]